MTAISGKLIVLYDGKCVLCRQSVRVIRALDWLKNVEPLDLHQSEVMPRFAQLDKEKLLGEMHVVTLNGETHAGFFAVRYISDRLPLGLLFTPLLYLPGMNSLGPKIYQWVAQRRYSLNRVFGGELCEDGVCKIKYE